MTEAKTLTDETYLLAAEYAFGLLGPDDAARAQLLENTDPDFANLLTQLRSKTDEWTAELPDVKVSDELWSRIDASVSSHTELAAKIATLDDARDNNARIAARKVRLWRASGVMAMAASLVLAIMLGLQINENRALGSALQNESALAKNQTGLPANVAQISDAQGELLLGAVFYPETGEMKLRSANFDDPQKAPELWVIDGTGTPRSLGIVSEGGSLVIQLSPELQQLLTDGATIAVTLEDPASAPHAAPTGDILGTSRLTSL